MVMVMMFVGDGDGDGDDHNLILGHNKLKPNVCLGNKRDINNNMIVRVCLENC